MQIAEKPVFLFVTKDDIKVHVEKKTTDCIYFSEDHKLYRCNAFLNQNLKARSRFEQEKRSSKDVYNQ